MSDLTEEMKAHALEAQRFSRKHLVLELDFSERSLVELEEQMDSVEYSIKGGKSVDNVAMLVRIWGAYLGESLRRTGKGEWVSEGDDANRRIGIRGTRATVYPHEQIRTRLLGTPADSVATFFRTAAETL